MFVFGYVRVYAYLMFGDVIRELAPGPIEGCETGDRPSAVRHHDVGTWPDAASVWRSGGSGRGRGDGADPLRSVGCGDGAGRHDGAVGLCGLGSLGYGDLQDLVVELAAERARVEGRYLAAVAEMASRHGAQATAYVLRDQTRLNASQARSEARLAETLAAEGMTATLDAMQAGEIGMAHAKVIAREAPKKHRRSEASFLELCRVYPSDTVARHPLAYESLEVFADLDAEAAAKDLSPLDAELAHQHAQRWGSMKLGDDGMWHLNGSFDFLAGRHINTALQAMVRSLRRRADNDTDTGEAADGTTAELDDGTTAVNGATDAAGRRVADGGRVVPTRAQLTADAIADLIAGTTSTRRRNTSLVIIADYDAVNDRLANPRLDDGTPLSAKMLADHAADADVLPAVFKSDWSELALGRTRNANDAQRLILAIRDGGCIGCDLTSEHTESHHIDYYENGGLTEVPNLASLCHLCHSSLHRHNTPIDTPPNGKPRLQQHSDQPTRPDSTDPTRPDSTDPP